MPHLTSVRTSARDTRPPEPVPPARHARPADPAASFRHARLAERAASVRHARPAGRAGSFRHAPPRRAPRWRVAVAALVAGPLALIGGLVAAGAPWDGGAPPDPAAAPAPAPPPAAGPADREPGPVRVTPQPAPPGVPASPRPGGAPAAACAVGPALVPSCGMWWGVAPDSHSGSPRHEALRRFEAETGRVQDVFHAYHRGKDLFPTAEEIAIAREPGRHRILFLNWKPQIRSWAEIAAGDEVIDAHLDRLAAHIRANFPEPFFFTVHHEPENDVRPARGSGWTARDYAAMFRYVVQRLRGAGVDNLVTVIAYMAYVPWNAQPWFEDLYPGDDVVDWVGWDAYAHSEPGYGHGDFAELMNRRSALHPDWPGFYAWAERRFPDKPLMLAEWGVWYSEDNPAHQARFYRSVARQLPRFPRLKAMVYFDSPRSEGRDSRPEVTTDALAAYRELGSLPLVRVDRPS